MTKIKNILSPLFLLFIWTLISGIALFTKPSGPEGWGHAIAFIICLFSLVPLLFDLILKVTIKNKRTNILVQIPIAVFIAFFYIKWELLNI